MGACQSQEAREEASRKRTEKALQRLQRPDVQQQIAKQLGSAEMRGMLAAMPQAQQALMQHNPEMAAAMGLNGGQSDPQALQAAVAKMTQQQSAVPNAMPPQAMAGASSGGNFGADPNAYAKPSESANKSGGGSSDSAAVSPSLGSEGGRQLHAKLSQCDSEFDREAVIKKEASNYHGQLTSQDARVIAGLFTMSMTKQDVVERLYPCVTDKGAFMDVVVKPSFDSDFTCQLIKDKLGL